MECFCARMDYVKRALRNCLWSRIHQARRLMNIHLQIHIIMSYTGYIDYQFVFRHSWNHCLAMSMRIPVSSSLFLSKYLIEMANLERSKEQVCDESLAACFILLFFCNCIQTNIPFQINKNSCQGVAISPPTPYLPIQTLHFWFFFGFCILLSIGQQSHPAIKCKTSYPLGLGAGIPVYSWNSWLTQWVN